MNDYSAMKRQFDASPIQDDAVCQNIPTVRIWDDLVLQCDKPSLLILSDLPWILPNSFTIDALATAMGFRILDQVALCAATGRLSRIVDVDAILLRCTGNEPGLDLLIARLDTMAANQGVHLIISVDLDGLDHVHAIVGAERTTLLCRPDYEDVTGALVGLASIGREQGRLHDSAGGDKGDPRLDRLSNEIVRLNRTIEALVQNRLPSLTGYSGKEEADGIALHSPVRSYSALPATMGAGESPITARQVRAVLRMRRLREQLFPPDIFADPAWDILLDLMAARLENTKVSVSSLCIAAAVPPTTALRWIRQLTDRKLLERQADPDDGRRVFIGLSGLGVDAVTRWFQESHVHMAQVIGQGDDGRGASFASRS